MDTAEINKFKHKLKVNVRFSDLDAMGHVNNATYLTYLEEARINYFNVLFNLRKESIEFEAVVARIDISYLYPVVLGDDIEVLTRVSKLGTKSVEVEHLIIIRRGEGIIKAASVLTTLVYFDYKTQRTKVMAAEVKNKIAEFEGLDF